MAELAVHCKTVPKPGRRPDPPARRRRVPAVSHQSPRMTPLASSLEMQRTTHIDARRVLIVWVCDFPDFYNRLQP